MNTPSDRPAAGGPSVPVWARLVEVAWLLLLWLLLRPLLRAIRLQEAVGWSEHAALGLLPAGVWLLSAPAAPWTASSGARGLLRALFGPSVSAALSPALLHVFLPQRPVLPLPALLLLVPLMLAGPMLLRTLLVPSTSGGGRSSGSGRAVGWLIAAELVAGLGGMFLADRAGFPSERWADLGREVARDASRILSAILMSWYLVLAHRQPAGMALAARRFVLRLPGPAFVGAAAALSVAACSAFAGLLLERMPHVQDEIAVHFQAKVFASGRLYAPAPPLPEFFKQEFIVLDGDRWYGKYQPGASLLLAAGVPFGLEWLIHPLLSGLGVVLLYLLGTRLVSGAMARLAVLLAVISPFWIMTFSSMMPHPGCLVTLLAGGWCLLRAVAAARPAAWALAAGALVGAGLLFRPYTAVVLGGTALALAFIVYRRGVWRPACFVPFVFGAVLMLIVTLTYNRALTGDSWTTPFQKYSAKDRLGFGADMGLESWRQSERGHGPARALRNLRINAESLGRTLLGWPTAGALLAFLPLLSARYRHLALSLVTLILCLPAAYTFYLYHGEVFGPRYWSESLPAWLVLTALGLAAARHAWQKILLLAHQRRPAARSRSALILAGIVVSASGATAYWPSAIDYYGHSLWHIDRSVRRAIRRGGLRNAVVFLDAVAYDSGQRWPDTFGTGFVFNTPTLDGDVVYARDLGERRNAELMALYPGRDFYAITPGELAEATFRRIEQAAGPAGPHVPGMGSQP